MGVIPSPPIFETDEVVSLRVVTRAQMQNAKIQTNEIPQTMPHNVVANESILDKRRRTSWRKKSSKDSMPNICPATEPKVVGRADQQPPLDSNAKKDEVVVSEVS